MAEPESNAAPAAKRPRSPYSTLPHEGPYQVRIGTALITMVEPHAGQEAAYNRWYEDDHFYAGAMAMPWMFAGRRWVAPRRLQALRYPDPSPIADPLSAGPYLSIYWITDGHYRDHLRWSIATNQRLGADDRVFWQRDHLYTSFQQYHGAVYRDGNRGPRDIHALDHPYVGLVMEVIDAPAAADREALLAWLRDEHIPARLRGGEDDGADASSPAAMCLMFTPQPLPGGKDSYVQDTPGIDERVTLLWFCEDDPVAQWDQWFARAGAAVAASGLGAVVFSSPFIPTIPGTEAYVDELR